MSSLLHISAGLIIRSQANISYYCYLYDRYDHDQGCQVIRPSDGFVITLMNSRKIGHIDELKVSVNLRWIVSQASLMLPICYHGDALRSFQCWVTVGLRTRLKKHAANVLTPSAARSGFLGGDLITGGEEIGSDDFHNWEEKTFHTLSLTSPQPTPFLDQISLCI